MKESTLAASSRLGGAVISDRVVASLLDELRTGRYAHADRLPAEVDLAAELGVSRTVIRDALSEMERAGYVERVRGIGTVVNRSVLGLRSRLDQKLEYYPLIRSFGSYPHADGIQVFPIRAGDELAHNLDIEPGDEVIITNLWEEIHYRVVETQIIQPNEVEQILIKPGRELVTLLTCHPYASGGRQRYLVICERINYENDE